MKVNLDKNPQKKAFTTITKKNENAKVPKKKLEVKTFNLRNVEIKPLLLHKQGRVP